MPIELDPLLPGDELSDWTPTRDQLEIEYGKDDVTTYANLQSNDPAASLTEDEIAAKIARAIQFAVDFISSRVRAAGFAYPLVALAGETLPNGLLNTIALCLTIWKLYRGRGKADGDKVGDKFQEDYDWAVGELDRLLLTLQAVADPTPDDDDPVGVFQYIDIDRDTTCVSDEFSSN